MLFAQGAYPQERCLLWGDFSSHATTEMVTLGEANQSQFALSGDLIYRPLMETRNEQWFAFQLHDAQVVLDKKKSASLIYSVPFAVKLDKQSGTILDYRFAAKLQESDQQKLKAIYRTIHLSKKPEGSKSNTYTVVEQDNLGEVMVEYQVTKKSNVTKSRLHFIPDQKKNVGNNMLNLGTPMIIKDHFVFKQDGCWYQSVTGDNITQVSSTDKTLKIHVSSTITFNKLDKPVPAESLILSLNSNPTKWQMISSDFIYPKAPRNPFVNTKIFLENLKLRDIPNMQKEELNQFLYDNEEHLMALLNVFRDGLLNDQDEKRLFLMLGKNDSPNSHKLLTNVFTAEDIANQSRFRSLMALKYSENPLSAEILDELFYYTSLGNEYLTGKSAQLSRSALMVMGIIAKNQMGSEFATDITDRLANQLNQSQQERHSAALLTALGNSGDSTHQTTIAYYLSGDSPLLRTTAAAALGHIPNPTTLNYLEEQLSTETNANTQIEILRSMGNNELSDNQVTDVFNYTKNNNYKIRGAAIDALSEQAKKRPGLKVKMKNLVKTERNEQNLRKLMAAIYGP